MNHQRSANPTFLHFDNGNRAVKVVLAKGRGARQLRTIYVCITQIELRLALVNASEMHKNKADFLVPELIGDQDNTSQKYTKK